MTTASNSFEKHFQTVVQVALTALCIWMANTTYTTSITVSTMNERVKFLQQEVDLLREATKNRYTAADATRDLDTVYRNIQRNAAEIQSLQERIRDIENDSNTE